MTIPENDILDGLTTEDTKRPVPEIKGEEDIPFPADQITVYAASRRRPADKKLGKTKSLTQFRFETGRTVLYVAMFVMGVMVVIDLLANHYWSIESDLLENAFEAVKLITTTVLGYIFGSNGPNNSDNSN